MTLLNIKFPFHYINNFINIFSGKYGFFVVCYFGMVKGRRVSLFEIILLGLEFNWFLKTRRDYII